MFRAKDKDKIKTYERKAMQSLVSMGKDKNIHHWYGIGFIVNEKLKNNIYKLGEVGDTIPFKQLARSRSKSKKKPR